MKGRKSGGRLVGIIIAMSFFGAIILLAVCACGVVWSVGRLLIMLIGM